MPVTVAKHAGFCFGVKRATDFVESLTVKEGAGTRIYTIGSLIHNRIYNAIVCLENHYLHIQLQ